jgi:hypothetical protein
MTFLLLLACNSCTPDYNLYDAPMFAFTGPTEEVSPGTTTVTFVLTNDALDHSEDDLALWTEIEVDGKLVFSEPLFPGEHSLDFEFVAGQTVRFSGVARERIGDVEQDSLTDTLDVTVCETSAYFLDQDGDGYGKEGTASCAQLPGYVTEGGDCDDDDPDMHPNADEVCDEVDNDCDGEVDEDAIDQIEGYVDNDGDGFGDVWMASCDPTENLVEEEGDCDDEDPGVHPGAEDVCDGVDNDCDGEDGAGGLNVPGDYATIGEAVDVAVDGDMVCVAPGTYTERFSFQHKDILVIGSGGSEVTLVDGQQNGTIVSFEGDETDDALLRGFTLLNGAGSMGGGVYAREGASPSIEDVRIEGASCPGLATCRGAAVALVKSQAVLIDVHIEGATALASDTVEGGAMYVDGGNVELLRVSFVDNTAEHTGSDYGDLAKGGALYVEGDLEGTNIWFSGNEVIGGRAYGGAAYVEQGELELTNVVAAQNVVEGDYHGVGGGFAVGTHGELSLENGDIVQNRVIANTYAHGGGAAWVQGAGDPSDVSWDLLNVSFHENDLIAVYEAGHGMYCYPQNAAVSEHVNWYGQDQDTATDCKHLTDDCVACIAADPLYSDADGLDLSLGAGSPLINAGTFDISDADGSRSDIGAYGGPEGASW